MKMMIPFFLALILLAACTAVGVKLKPSKFCVDIPTGSSSVICEIANEMGTTPEAISTALKVGNLAAIDGIYTAKDADAFLAMIQHRLAMYRDLGGATWPDVGQYLLGQYNLMPPKVAAIFVLAKDIVEFDSPMIHDILLSDYDWNGIEKHIREQRALIAPYIK